MKKLIISLICTGLLLCSLIPANAFEIFYQQTSAPVITEGKFISSENSSVSISFTSGLSDAELIRDAAADAIIEFIGSEENFLKSEYRYLSYKTKNYLQISTDNSLWLTLAQTEKPDHTFSISYKDLLKALITAGAATENFASTGEFYARILTASENFADEEATDVFAYKYSDSIKITGDKFSFVYFVLPADASFGKDILTITDEPSANDTELFPADGSTEYIPLRKGYDFFGWSVNGTDGRTGIIPGNTRAVTLVSHWQAIKYEINYVVATKAGYPFGRADLSDLYTEYTTDKDTPVYDISSPIAGYQFDGWYYTEDFSGEKITAIEKGSTGDKVLYAKWLSLEELAAALKERQEKYIKEKKFGDIDDDGRITAADARLIIRASVGLENFSAEILRRADYNNSGKISALNARTTLRVSVGLDSLYLILLNNGMLDSVK